MARDEWYPQRAAWWRHPKVAALSLEAAGLWAKGRSYIADNHLSGFIPRTALGTIASGRVTRRALSELTTGDSPLWETVDGGWYLHDFEHHEGGLEQRRRADRDRQRRKRDTSRDVTPESRSQTKTETKTQSVVSNDTTPLKSPGDLEQLVTVWNAYCGDLPQLRGVPANGGEVHRLMVRVLDYFRGDWDAIGAAVTRCSRDDHYRRERYGFSAFARHVDRWDDPAGPASMSSADAAQATELDRWLQAHEGELGTAIIRQGLEGAK